MDPDLIENEFPSLASTLKQISEGQHPLIQAINISPAFSTLIFKDGSKRKVNVKQPNSLCYCGSNRKYKKCCASKVSDPPLYCQHCHKEVKVVKNQNDQTTCRCYDRKLR
jgi:hypothetical protein